MKASDLPDQRVMEGVALLARPPGGRQCWVMLDDLAGLLNAPRKVVLAKVCRIIRRGMLGGPVP